MGDEIPRLDTRVIRRRAVDGRDDLHEALFLRDLDPQTAEFAACLDAHVGRVIGRQVAGMRIKRGEHPVDRRLDQFARVHLFDILRADAFEDVAEQVQLLVHVRGAGAFLRDQRAHELRGGHDACQCAAHGRHDYFFHSVIPLSSVNHPRGSSGVSPSLTSI